MNFTVDKTGLIFTFKALAGGALAVFLVGIFSNLAFNYAYPQIYRRQNLASALDLLENGNKISLAFVGDIMLDRRVKESIIKNGGGDFRYPFLKIAGDLKKYDILFGNLEGPISERGEETGNKYSFRMSLDAAEGLAFAGFDIVSLANNHAGDWGEEAIYYTLQHLKDNNIATVGAGRVKVDAYNPKIISANGARIAFLAFTESTGAFLNENNVVAKIDSAELVNSIKVAKQKSDIVVVYFHFGDEYKKEPNSYQQAISHLAIDSGADLVVGSHPHVIEPIEKYENGFIAYSLGNFIFDQDFSEETMRGSLLEVEIKDKAIQKVTPRSIFINNLFQPNL